MQSEAAHLSPTSTANKPAFHRLMRPRSVAIVGASASPGAFGASVLNNLKRAHYDGELYLVNPKRAEIGGKVCYASVDDLPAGLDCAVLAIPRAGVIAALEACARRHIGAVIIFSAGFAESGAAGRAEQERIREIAAAHGMVIEGPNCLGLVNYVDGIPLTFILTEVLPPITSRGVATVSQSGAMAAVLGVILRHHELGLTYSVSTGNEAASGVEDYVEFMVDDPHTKVIVMIVEHFRHPRRFLELVSKAQRAAKHIVLLHPGRSSAAKASAATHTGAMAGDYEIMRTKVEYAGVLLVETLEELADVAEILVRCPQLPKAGAAIFTESGAFKALALDICERLGLELPVMGEATATALRAVLPDFIPPTNPLDITAQGLVDPDLYRRTLPPILADDRYGSVLLTIIMTNPATSAMKMPTILAALKKIKPTKPVLFAAMDEGAEMIAGAAVLLRSFDVPFFPSPERALRALAVVTAAGKRPRQTSANPLPQPSSRLAAGVHPEYRSKQILADLGIPVPEGALATSAEAAVTIAERLGFPVVLKAQAVELIHKSDVGGVALNLGTREQVLAAWAKMHQDLSHAYPALVLDGVLVECMAKRGIELIVGARNDPEWGAVVMIGGGGVMAEAMQDFRLMASELSPSEVARELHLLKAGALLRGFRGAPAADVDAAAHIVCKLGAWMRANPSVTEVDINPLVVYPQGAVALDALIVAAREVA